MNNDNVIAFQSSETVAPFSDALSELVRQGARQIIAQAVEAELKEFLAHYQSLKDDQGRQVIVRNGYLPERTITTGVGEVEIQVPKVRDRSSSGIKFNSSLGGVALTVPQRSLNGRFFRSVGIIARGTGKRTIRQYD